MEPTERVHMFRMLIAAVIVALTLSACVIAPGPYDRGVVVAPPLPVIVELGPELYFYQHRYHYQYEYRNDRWRYATSRSGPWMDLPRSHYPREVRFRDTRGVVIAPPLPVIVELGPQLYFYQHRYHYQYEHHDDRWRYATSRSGPWMDLPRSHYPREIRFKDARGAIVAPPLPRIVELGRDPYFQHRGYYYHYQQDNGRWRYATSRSGPWSDLPRSHYPGEVRFRDGTDRRDRDRDDRRRRD